MLQLINKTMPIMTNSKMHPDPILRLLQENPQIIFWDEISQNKMLLMPSNHKNRMNSIFF